MCPTPSRLRTPSTVFLIAGCLAASLAFGATDHGPVPALGSVALFSDPASIAYRVEFTQEGALLVGQGLNYPRAQWWETGLPRPDWETPFGTGASRVEIVAGEVIGALGTSVAILRTFLPSRPDPILDRSPSPSESPAAIAGCRNESRLFWAGPTGDDLEIVALDELEGRERWRTPINATGRLDGVQGLRADNRGERIVLTTYRRLHLVDGTTGQLLDSTPHYGQSVADISGDGTIAVSGDFDGHFRVYGLETDRFELVYEQIFDNAWPSAVVSNDGRVAAIGIFIPSQSDESRVVALDLDRGQVIWSRDVVDFPAIAISANGERIAVGTWGDLDDRVPDLWVFDLESSDPLLEATMPGSVYSVALDADAGRLAVGTKIVHARILGRGGEVHLLPVPSPGQQHQIDRSGLAASPMRSVAAPSLQDEVATTGTGGILHERMWAQPLAMPHQGSLVTTGHPLAHWQPADQWLNPGGVAATNRTVPCLLDVDGDDEAELVMGESNGGLALYRRNGRHWARSPWMFDGLDTGTSVIHPAAGDLDDDGYDDLVVGRYDGTLRILWNIQGGARWRVDSLSVAHIDVGLYAAPELADLDADGNLDLLVGSFAPALQLWRNIGTPQTPVFEAAPPPLDSLVVGYASTPMAKDPDGDGDLDLLVGRRGGDLLHRFENVGTPQQAIYVRRLEAGGGLRTGWFCAPEGQGTPAGLIIGQESGPTTHLVGRSRGDMVLDGDGFRAFDVGARSIPAPFPGGLVVGGSDGLLRLLMPGVLGPWEIVPGAFETLPVIEEAAPTALSLGPEVMLVVGGSDGSLRAFRGNQGSSWVEDIEWPAGIHVDEWASPWLSDLDGDGRTDLAVGNGSGTLHFWWNNGSDDLPDWAADDTVFEGLAPGTRPLPRIQDLTGDGRPDLLLGSLTDGIQVYRNAGLGRSPQWEFIPGGGRGVAKGFYVAPALVEVDGSSPLELVIGDLAGGLVPYRAVRDVPRR